MFQSGEESGFGAKEKACELWMMCYTALDPGTTCINIL